MEALRVLGIEITAEKLIEAFMEVYDSNAKKKGYDTMEREKIIKVQSISQELTKAEDAITGNNMQLFIAVEERAISLKFDDALLLEDIRKALKNYKTRLEKELKDLISNE